MTLDVLTLGQFTFTDFGVPDIMMGGGKQAMVMHKLPGGSRVIDTLGPDEEQIIWNGVFLSNDAYTNALQLDAMRAAGSVLILSWGGQSRQVIIESFIYRVHRLPTWVEYVISCAVYVNPALGNTDVQPSGSADAQAAADTSSASDAGNAANDTQPAPVTSGGFPPPGSGPFQSTPGTLP